MRKYLELTLHCTDEESAEIATAFIADYPFESFDTELRPEEVLLRAYIPAEGWSDLRSDVLANIADYVTSTDEREVEDENWNASWEAENLSTVAIESIMVIRPADTPPPADSSVIDVIVAPQMSFGSGQHHTTRLMCRLIYDYTPQGQMLDVGCGTGVLSIAAIKCGATHATAIDIDPWSIESTRNAATLNGLESDIRTILGTVEAIRGERFDMVAANIMRNIIIEDMSNYYEALNSGGRLLLSGFLEDDYAAVRSAAEELGLSELEAITSGGWVASVFEKR